MTVDIGRKRREKRAIGVRELYKWQFANMVYGHGKELREEEEGGERPETGNDNMYPMCVPRDSNP